MGQELKKGNSIQGEAGKRVFGVVCRGFPVDFQSWLDSAKAYDIYVVFSKSTRTSKLVIVEVPW